MKKTQNFLFLILLIIITTASFLGSMIIQNANPGENNQNGLRKVENKAFNVGEWLRFDISYGFIHAGTATLSIPEYRTMNDRKCYYIKAEAFSASGFSWIFKVEDKYETYIDIEGIYPWRFEQHIREGKFKADNIASFDQYKKMIYTKDANYPAPEYVHDILSAFFYTRTQNFSNSRVGQIIKLQNFFKDKVYPLEVKFLGRQEIEVNAGKFQCIIVEPLIKEGGLFKHQGRLLIWLSDDDRKIPVKMTSAVVVGSISVELDSYSGLNGPLNSKR
jgi:hypothetical protein